MAIRYPQYIETINSSENIGDSLIKINNNFWNIQEGFCKFKKQIASTIQVRTFFYYGPNAAANSTSGMQDGLTTRPSNVTIENFINSTNQLNIPAISKLNDIAYVIYQKTGYLALQATRTTSGTVPVLGTSPAQNVPVTTTNDPIFNPPLTKPGPWSTTTPERYNYFSPVFIIWKLIFNGTAYITDFGFPKFSQAETLSTPNWNNPRVWSKY
jgi:hypothetical protein